MTREEWYLLPFEFRHRWWQETNFDRHDPPPETKAEADRLIEQAKAAKRR